MQKKAQTDFKAVFLTFIVAGLIGIIGVMVFSNVSNTSDQLFNPDLVQTNESVTISATAEGFHNSTLLALDGYINNSERVTNGSSPFTVLTRNIDYRIDIVNGGSGELTTQANFTLLNISTGTETGFNNTPLFVRYDHNEQSSAQATKANLDTTVLDSFDLGVVAVLVLAAVLLIGSLFYLGSK